MFGNRRANEAMDQRKMAIEVAFHAIILANNGEQILENLNLMVQYILDENGNQYPYDDAMYVRNRILDKLKKRKGDKSYMETNLDWKKVEREEFNQALSLQLKANSVPKSIRQARDDYFHRLSAGHPEKEKKWRMAFKDEFGCDFY